MTGTDREGRGPLATGARLGIALLVTTACSGSETRYELVLPAHDARAALVIVDAHDGAPSVEAFDPRAPFALRRAIPLDRDVSVVVLLYDELLDTLSLSAGRVALETSTGGRPLPVADRVLRGGVIAGEHTALAEIEAAPVDVAALRLPVVDLCGGSFTPRLIDLPARSPVSALVALDVETVLAATKDGALFVVRRSEAPEPIESPSTVFDGYARTDGTVFLGAEDGEVLRGEWSRGEQRFELVETATLATQEDVIAIDGRRDGPIEHFTFTENIFNRGIIEYYDGRTSTPWFQRTSPIDLAYEGPAQVAVAWGHEVKFIRARDGLTEEIDLPDAATFSGIEALEHVAGLGTVFGLEHGGLFWLSEEGWSRQFFQELVPALRLTPYLSSVAVVSNIGLYRVSDGTVCDLLTLPRDRPLELGEEVVSAGPDLITTTADEPLLVWFERSP